MAAAVQSSTKPPHAVLDKSLNHHTTELSDMATAKRDEAVEALQTNLQGHFGDFRDELRDNGFVVVKGAIPANRAREYQQRAFKWLSSFGTPFDLEDPSTWTEANLPVQSKINTFQNYCAPHEGFMWDARMEPGVLDAFAKVWGTDELLVSFDALNITLPNRKDRPRRKPWPHVDQSPKKRGLHCVQGIINLSHAGEEDGSLMVLPRSNAHHDEFLNTQTDPADWTDRDFRPFSPEEMEWFSARDMTPIKVHAEPGDLILWDSRTCHWGAEPTEKSTVIRTVIYASYSPARLATPEALAAKAKVFNVYGATTHWAHDNIYLREKDARLPDGTVDPRERAEPYDKPEMTDQLLKLAGITPYLSGSRL